MTSAPQQVRAAADPAVEAELERLPTTPIADLRKRYSEQLVKSASAKPNGRLELPRRIKPGSELVRTWNRKTYRVMVMAEGFAYDGKAFASLSEIASAITGTRWNGPRFFGLRSSSNREDADGK
jgi:Protein of unknown function (DUF2924)